MFEFGEVTTLVVLFVVLVGLFITPVDCVVQNPLNKTQLESK